MTCRGHLRGRGSGSGSVCVNCRATLLTCVNGIVNVLGMVTYVKLFGEILDSSVWQLPVATRIVWITMLAMKDRDHVVRAAVPGLASRARVSLKECEEALDQLMSPDKYSRSKAEDGRRIRVVDGGWEVVNGEEYRNRMSREERREYQRIKQAEYRARKSDAAPKESRKARQIRLNEEARQQAFLKAEERGDQKAADRIAAGEEP